MPLPVRHALRKLGRDIRDARRRRRIPAAIAAQRASISRTTLVKLEKGDPGVAIGLYATVLFVLGMADRLGDLPAPKNDPVGVAKGSVTEVCNECFRLIKPVVNREIFLRLATELPRAVLCVFEWMGHTYTSYVDVV